MNRVNCQLRCWAGIGGELWGGELWVRVKLVFLPFAGAVFSFPTVCHPVATQTFVSLSEDREGRTSFGCGASLIPSQAIFVATMLVPWGKWVLL